jgi:predicted translin family RNA/ssDNA-binding protein
MKKLIEWVKSKIEDYKRKKKLNKKLEELRKKDPFMYNH